MPDDEILRIARTYHAWRGRKAQERTKTWPAFATLPLWMKSRSTATSLHQGGTWETEEIEEDEEPFKDKLEQLVASLKEQFRKSKSFENQILASLEHIDEAHSDSFSLAEVAEITTGKLDSNAATRGGEFPFFTCSP